MAQVTVKFVFQTILTQKEFSVVTRALAGHELKAHDVELAIDLNKRLLKARLVQVQDYARQAARALEVAEEESKEIENG